MRGKKVLLFLLLCIIKEPDLANDETNATKGFIICGIKKKPSILTQAIALKM